MADSENLISNLPAQTANPERGLPNGRSGVISLGFWHGHPIDATLPQSPCGLHPVSLP
jgi:hypothetical protein